MSTSAARNPVDEFLAAVVSSDVAACDAWADDVVLDATVPNWRMHRRGAAAVRAEYVGWFHDPARLDGLRRIPIVNGETVEYTVSWQEDGVPHAAHHVHILGIANQLIVSDTVMCGGRWPAALLAEMEKADNA